MKQFFYKYITTPIAKTIDFINVSKQIKLRRRRKAIALKNKSDYIETTAKILLDTEIQQKMNEGLYPNPLFFHILVAQNINKAIIMFNEKKAHGDFDELNIMLK